MESTKETATKQSFFHALTNSLTFRGLLVGILVFLLLIPLIMVDGIVRERNNYQHSVLEDISRGWGDDQTIIGPVLSIPYVEHTTSAETVTDSSGVTKTVSRDVFKDKTLILLPEDLNMNATLNSESRKRGIYKALVYTADLDISGRFNLDALPQGKNISVRWKKAWLAIGLSDTKAIRSTSPLRWGENSTKFEPGTRLSKIIPNGFHASMRRIPKSDNMHPSFKIQLSFKGKTSFKFAPVGESSMIKVESRWPHPSFQGDILPTAKIISPDGFSAEWNIPHLTRNYPQSWLRGEESYKLNSITTGVNLFRPVTLYSKVSRAVKYGILVIALTFLTFLIFELTVKAKMHIVQYAIVGIALILFYLLLISLSERIPFMMAYIYAASTVVGIISVYTLAVLRSFSKGLFIFILLASLYAALYFILQMEDYALLAGSGVMLFVVVVLMIATRNLTRADEAGSSLDNNKKAKAHKTVKIIEEKISV